MAGTKFDIEKFDGVTNFNMWQVRMIAILVQRLEIIYATKSLANHLVLKQRLFTFRMNGYERLRDHISQFITLLNDLKNVEVKINDEDQAMLLLCSLPSSYKSFRETLIYGKDKLSFEDVKGHLLSKNKLDNKFCLDSKADKAAESNNGHVVGANLADKSDDDFFLVLTSDSFELMSEWILDLGCSFHMCPSKEWFSAYNSVEGGVMRMRNDSSSKVISIGTIKIRMHYETIRTLSDVRNAPDLQKNHISLTILYSKGCKINIDSSDIKVSHGALVLLKGFEKLGHCVRQNQTWVSFDLAVHKSKVRSLPASKYRFDLVNSLHNLR
ncbi:hypothetical protein J1N35_033817 [Gossypium stocksii]|uniref:Retrovirus-related Pol polyprotein from transposon TNT 1-94-like beta-barrel domain-containing protein n=1 Tax=Gossypium stocksii TaxID=47602 RepID=A0A9D3UQX4_9ROSI|nr:hypothetical protein J1N35_033817 [Gossypium stocksii]